MRLYEPLDTLKEVSEGLWVVDGGVSQMKLAIGLRIPFPTRMVVIKLPSGELALWSPVSPTDSLRAQIDELGRVAHLISPNKLHYAQLATWKGAYPSAVVWASPGVRERARANRSPVIFDAELGDVEESAWGGVLDQMIFRGSRVVEEIVFFHRKSRTLILADLIENFEPSKLGPVMAATMLLVGATDPDGKATLNYRMTFAGNHRVARLSLERVLAWAPDKVIIAHGRWYERDGVAELRRAFRWLTR
jgi:glyoxylase-like metal-dependent hydrolase (beta-lactamase superfamily II)